MTIQSHIQNKPPKVLVQPKLIINSPGDIYEQEADAMADRVMRMSSYETAKPVTGLIGKSLQRKCAHCEEEKRRKPVMRKAEAGNSGMPVSSSFAATLNASKGGGSPLPQGTRSFMENAFSTDFSGVNIHNDNQALKMNQCINARAFTYGSDIYFGGGEYSPNTHEGKSLLAHELTHVVQQANNKIQHSIHRKENILNKKIIKIIAFKEQLMGQAVLSDNSIVNITLSENTLEEPGNYTYFIDAGEQYNYKKAYSDPRPGGFLWNTISVYGQNYKERTISEEIEVVIIEGDTATQQASIAAMPYYIKKFLIKGEGKTASHEEIEDTIRAGFHLVKNGITEDELLLYEIENQMDIDKGTAKDTVSSSDWAVNFINIRQGKIDAAIKNRHAFRAEYLKDHVNDSSYQRIVDADKWGIDFSKIKHDTPDAGDVSDDIILKAFEYELKSNTQTFLSQILLVLLKIEKRFITDSWNAGVGKNALETSLIPLKTAVEQKERAESEYAELQIQRGIAKLFQLHTGQQKIVLDGQIEEAEDDFESKSRYLLELSNSVNLPVLNLPNFSLSTLVKAKREHQQGLLKSFVFDARQKIERASGLLNDSKYLYKADKMVNFTKDNLGIREKSYTNALINKKIESATTDSVFEEIVNIASILSIFIPGGIGLLIRMGVSTVSMSIEFGKYDDVSTMHSTSLSSEKPSIMGSVLALGFAFLDASDLAKGVVKIIGGEAEAAVKVADDLVVAETLGRLEKGETRIGWDGRLSDALPTPGVKGISDEAAQRVSSIAQRENLFIRFRPVDEGVVKLRALGHPAKPEILKMKTIKKIDLELGAREIDIDQVGFFTPKKPANFDQLPLSYQEELTARFESRMKEISDYSDQVKQLESAGTIRREGNVIVDVKTGKGYTGDYDLFDIRKGGKDGENIAFESLSPEVQAELKGSGIEVQHGAAIDWDVPEGYADSYAAQVIGGRPTNGNKPLVQFNPDGSVSEGYFDD